METNAKYWKVSGVYKLACKNNGKVYIGKAVNIGRRLNDHKNSKKDGKGNCYFQHAILKHGWESFNIEILEIFENFDKLNDNDKLLQRESYYIELFDSTNRDIGYNRCKFSSDNTGRVRSEEHKQKLRHPRSEETKERIRQARLGKKTSDETKEKLRQANLGKKRSEDTKAKIGMKSLGRTHSDETKEKIRQSKLGKSHTYEHIENMKKAKLQSRQSKL